MNVDEIKLGRGRQAERPTSIPLAGWLDIFTRVRRELGEDHVSLVAAGVAMFAMLATFPALAAITALFGLMSDRADVVVLISTVVPILPAEITQILEDFLSSLVRDETNKLGFSAVLGLLLALWSARRGMAALIRACSVVYEEPRRGFFASLILSIAFTLGATGISILVLSLGVVAPALIELENLPASLEIMLTASRWLALWIVVIVALGIIYRTAPNRRDARWRWVSVGAVAAASIFIIGSIAFSYYVRTWANYGDSYGALGGVVVMLLWFYMTSYTIIFGAELNAEIEHQTMIDTTVGPDKPMGSRGAYVADTVGKSREEYNSS